MLLNRMAAWRENRRLNEGAIVSLLQIVEILPDPEAARVYLEDQRWQGKPACPHCGGFERITARQGKRRGYYRCRDCKEEFTVRTASIFERSHVPLHKWIYAIYLLVKVRKSISSMQLSKELSVTQATAWFILGRLREACGGDFGQLRGVVDIDETFISGKDDKKHTDKKLNAGRGTVDKQTVLGVRERDGRFIAMPVEGHAVEALHRKIPKHVDARSTVCIDERTGYGGIENAYDHGTVNYVAVEYIAHIGANAIHVNSAESMWAVLKRGLYGTWHKASVKHLHRYVNQATFRLSERATSKPTRCAASGLSGGEP